jgi:hypothetical protein
MKNSYSLGLAGVRCRPVLKIEDLNFSSAILENSMYSGDCCKAATVERFMPEAENEAEFSYDAKWLPS